MYNNNKIKFTCPKCSKAMVLTPMEQSSGFFACPYCHVKEKLPDTFTQSGNVNGLQVEGQVWCSHCKRNVFPERISSEAEKHALKGGAIGTGFLLGNLILPGVGGWIGGMLGNAATDGVKGTFRYACAVCKQPI